MATAERIRRDTDADLARRLAIPVESARALRLIAERPADEMLCMPLLTVQPVERLGLVRGVPSGTTGWRGRMEPTRQIEATEAGRAELSMGADRAGA